MDALRAFWRWEGHDRMPAVLVSTVEWLDEDGRREADRRVLAELADRGLLAGGTVAKEVRATFHTLTRPEIEVFGWISTPQRTLGVLAAGSGGEAVLMVRSGDTAQVSPVRPDDVAEVVVAQLPAVQPAHGRSVNVSETDFTGAQADSEEGFGGFGNQHESPDTRALKALFKQPVLGISQFWTSARGADGRLRRAETPITVRDTAEGRWLTQTTTASGRRWVIAAPAGPQLVTSKLYEVLRGLG
ncbi:EspG family protein [Kutzneria sp. CA-103260]|nr:EspG family protein [Kutzneria sp. CA-103260]